MREQFVNSFIARIQGDFDADELGLIRDKLLIHTLDYAIEKTCTELAVRNAVPEEVKIYIATRSVEGLSKNTLKLYKDRLCQFFEAVGVELKNVQKAHVIAYIYGLECSDHTKSCIMTIIKTFFGWCVAEGYLAYNPCQALKPIKYKKTLPEHLTDMEIEMLRAACKNAREKAIIEFFYSTGCRVDEARTAKRSDINFQTGEIKIVGKGNKERIAYLNSRSIIALKEYFLSRSDGVDAVFVTDRKPVRAFGTNRMLQLIVEAIGDRSGVQKHVHPHMIRHTNATLSLEKGMPLEEVQKVLGHSNINTTLTYAKVATENVKMHHRRYVV